MFSEPMSYRVKSRLTTAANRLRTADPNRFVGPMLEESFRDPFGDPAYGNNPVEPGAAPAPAQQGGQVPQPQAGQ